MKYTHQKSSDKMWKDETGVEIPFNRTTKVERLHERLSVKVAKQALLLNQRLQSFNSLISELSQTAFDEYMLSQGIEGSNQKNFIWYNFDKSIKIEIKVNEPIVFDDLKIQASQVKLEEFLKKELHSNNEFVKSLILDAFNTSRGKLDTKKILMLTKHEARVNKPLFSEAVKLINEAITRPTSKTYRRVWIKDESGKYENIELNLSGM